MFCWLSSNPARSPASVRCSGRCTIRRQRRGCSRATAAAARGWRRRASRCTASMRCPLVSKMLVLQHICGLDFSAGAASAGLVSIYSCPQLGAACWAQLQSSSWKPHSVDLTGAAPAGCHPAGVYTTGGQAAGSSAAAQQEGYTFYLRPDDSSQASVTAAAKQRQTK